MPLINTSVPNLIQGVSQQPDATRFVGQCEEQENALSSVAEGLKKRPNTRHISRLLTTAIDSNSFVHFINRDDNEKYVVIHDGSTIRAWNILTGLEATINGTTGGYTPVTDSYLDSSSPKAQLKALTVADNTFLLNTSVQTSIDEATTSPKLDKRAFVFIKQADYGKSYTIETGTGDTIRFEVDPSTLQTQLYSRFGSVELFLSSGGNNYTANTVYAITYRFLTHFTSNVPRTIYARTDSGGSFTELSSDNSTFGNRVRVASNTTAPSITNYSFEYPTPETTNQGNSGFGSITSVTGDSTSASNARTRDIILELYEKTTVTTKGGYNANIDANFDTKYSGNGLLFTLKDTSTSDDFSIITRDDLADSGMGVIYKEVDSLSDLPLSCVNGFVTKIKGDAELNQDDYYVKFVTADGSSWSQGSWEETISPDTPLGFDKTTMPHRLVSTGLNSFEILESEYSTRTVGDALSNPAPSFIGYPISNMFFFKNRLGFISNENIILSEAGETFNFFRNTVTTLLDSAPIDVAVSSGQVTNLKAAKGFQENLILFSENGQFALKGGGVLTPKTVSITPITNFSFEDQVDPLPLGSYIYFPFTRGAFTGMREFTVNASTDNYDSTEVTEHVPAYIPKNIIDMAGTTSEDMIVLLSGDEKGSLYIYNYFWNNNQKVLSAWSKFTFTGEIRGMEFIESTLYAVITNNGETNLVEMPLESGLTDAAGYVTHLDMRVASTVSNGSSTITLPYTPANNSVEVYTTDGLKLNVTNSGATVTLAQAVSADTPVFTGIPYTMKYTFSEQLFKAKAGNGTSPSNAAKLLIRNGSIYFDKTAFFKVKVTPKFRDTYENIFTPDVIGSTTIGTLNLDSGFYRFPVLTKAQDTTITIENDSALPSNFQSAEFESFVHSRSNRYG